MSCFGSRSVECLKYFSKQGFLFCTFTCFLEPTSQGTRAQLEWPESHSGLSSRACVSLRTLLAPSSGYPCHGCTQHVHIHSDVLLSSESLSSQREMIKKDFFFSFRLKDTALFALSLEYDFCFLFIFSLSKGDVSFN